MSVSLNEQIQTVAGSCGWNVVSTDEKGVVLSCALKSSITCVITPMSENTVGFSISSPVVGTALKAQFGGMVFDNLDVGYALPQVLRSAVFFSLKLGENPVEQYKMAADGVDMQSEEETYRQAKEMIAREVHSRNLFLFWKNRCALTGLDDRLMLVATFAKDPKDCVSAAEKMDNHNGFLLEARYARLFEAGYITFEKDGEMKISPNLGEVERKILAVDPNLKLRKVERLHQKYLTWHRQHVFRDETKKT